MRGRWARTARGDKPAANDENMDKLLLRTEGRKVSSATSILVVLKALNTKPVLWGLGPVTTRVPSSPSSKS